MKKNISIPNMRRIDGIHFVGIGGAGMCGIAEVLINQGYSVSGSDIKASENTRRLQALGAKIHIGHQADNVIGVDVLVVSTAIDDDNPEIAYAKQQRVPIVPTAEMLSEIMRYRHGIAVAGTHGKTTTTSMIASVLAAADLDPTFIIGGLVNNFGTNARLGESQYVVAEADESDASFLHLQPLVTVITNIEEDHMSTYDGDVNKLKKTFIDFIHNLPFYGMAIVCIDDPIIKEIMPKFGRAILTYGFDQQADFSIQQLQQSQDGSEFVIAAPNNQNIAVKLSLPGKHNVLNATAAVAVGIDEGIATSAIVEGIQRFKGVGRRFEYFGEYPSDSGTVHLVDDYGHHPTEVAATIEASRQRFPENRIIMIFQPHRYSRTKDLYDEFVEVLSNVDVLLVLDVYAAGEKIIVGADSKSICHSIRQRGELDPIHVKSIDDVRPLLIKMIQQDDVVLTQGAGNVGALAKDLSQRGFIDDK